MNGNFSDKASGAQAGKVMRTADKTRCTYQGKYSKTIQTRKY